MADDVVFLTPGQEPFGKEAFAAASRASHGKVRIDAQGEVQEVHVAGDLAYCRTRLRVTVAPTPAGEPRCLAGPTLSILRRQPNGRWLRPRVSTLVTAEPEQRPVGAAVPVFQVASVAGSVAWYRDVLGSTAARVGPPDEPVFAILHRDGVELMLQKACPDAP